MKTCKITLYKGPYFKIIADDYLLSHCKRILTFTAKDAANEAKLRFVFTQYAQYVVADHGIIVPIGFIRDIRALARKLGYHVSIEDLFVESKPLRFKMDLSKIPSDVRLREGQLDILKLIGRDRLVGVDCPTGYGKSFLFDLIIRVFPYANLDIISKSRTVLIDTLYRDLSEKHGGQVGLVTGGKCKEARVICATIKSYHKTMGMRDPDIVLIDEVDQLGTDSCTETIATRLADVRAKVASFSATWMMRSDKRDFNYLSFAGRAIKKIDYQEGVKNNIVAQLRISVRRVVMPDPIYDEELPMHVKERLGIWRNPIRNAIIAEDARSFDDDKQVVILVSTIEHALALKLFLPEYELVYGVGAMNRKSYGRSFKDRMIKNGLWLPGYEEITEDRLRRIAKEAELGIAKKIIATSVFDTGVNLKKLDVLIRAGSVASKTKNIQANGRNSRLGGIEGKVRGEIRDYSDEFNETFHRRWKEREKICRAMGWEVRFID